MFSQMMKGSHVQRSMMLAQHQLRFFGVTPKLAKLELTMRTPYRTIFENCSTFKSLRVRTLGGDMTIGNKS